MSRILEEANRRQSANIKCATCRLLHNAPDDEADDLRGLLTNTKSWSNRNLASFIQELFPTAVDVTKGSIENHRSADH